jgi:hypothetical protein
MQPHMLSGDTHSGVVPEHAFVHEAQCVALRGTQLGPALPLAQHSGVAAEHPTLFVVSQTAQAPPVTQIVPAVFELHASGGV